MQATDLADVRAAVREAAKRLLNGGVPGRVYYGPCQHRPDDVRAVASAWLAEHDPTDDELVDADWLMAQTDLDVTRHDWGYWVREIGLEWWTDTGYGWWYQRSRIWDGQAVTRGHIRRLASALKGQSPTQESEPES